MKKLVYILLLIPICLFSQQGASYPYYLYSENGDYFLKSIPHEGQMWNISGRTDIFRSSDSCIIYSINRYFSPNGIILSNDGSTILYARSVVIKNTSFYKKIKFDDKVIHFYRNGLLEKSYTGEQLVKLDLDYSSFSLFYENQKASLWMYWLP